MAPAPSLPEKPALLIADTSVVINMNATGFAEKLLKALPHRVAVVDVVVDEIKGGLRKGRQDAVRLAQLIDSGLVEVVTLGPQGLIQFVSLVIGASSGTLDDGEAATIAYAADVGAHALIEERKARRLAADQYTAVPLGCTRRRNLFGAALTSWMVSSTGSWGRIAHASRISSCFLKCPRRSLRRMRPGGRSW